VLTDLGTALLDANDIEGAIAQHRKALALDPKLILARRNLGRALEAKRDYDGAIEQYRKIIEIDARRFDACDLLAQAQVANGQFAEARKTYVQTLKLAPAKDPAARAAPQGIKQCDYLLAQDKTLTEFMAGADAPEAYDEQIGLAVLCRKYKRYYVTAARLYASALAGEPKLADDMARDHRFHAACCAVLAAAGKGADPRKAGAEERVQLREHALKWLGADLAWFVTQFQAGDARGVLLALERIPAWQTDASLVSVRDPKALAELPAEEQNGWQQFWPEAARLFKQIHAGIATTDYAGKLTDQEREHVREIKVEAGKQYIIDMRSADVDSFLKLLDPAGKLLGENDNATPDTTDARLILAPKEAGSFRVVATSYREQGRGEFTLTIRTVTARQQEDRRPNPQS
jgi:tetratricopeptide (TPR) repeat protein